MEFNFYTNTIKDQILPATAATSMGSKQYVDERR